MTQRTLNDADNKVRNWNVEQVLMWLKYTTSGMFEEYCPVFQAHHVHGECLLSLNNEILRDEFKIRSYGKRFDLLKSIQKLTRKSSLSSSTFYKQTPENSLNNDNWENLNVIASNTNIMDSLQIQNLMDNVVSELTGTEINKQTREKHSFYRKLSNLSLPSQPQITNKPNWDNIATTKVIQHSWDETSKKWISNQIYVKIAPLPFSRGSLRMSYYCLNLGDNPGSNNANHATLFNKLIGNSHAFGGKLCVAKKHFGVYDSADSKSTLESIKAYFYDVRTQCEAQKFAKLYNAYDPPKKIAFLKASVIEIMDNENKTENTDFYCLESFVYGSYVKHIDNRGSDEKIRNTPSAFAHFSYEASNKRLLICDIQGVGDIYTDPQIHTYNATGYGIGNLGNDGIIKFFKTHECNAICKHFKFNYDSSKNGSMINAQLIYGTRAHKQYMEKNKIDAINTKYIDNNNYLLQIPQLFYQNININIYNGYKEGEKQIFIFKQMVGLIENYY